MWERKTDNGRAVIAQGVFDDYCVYSDYCMSFVRLNEFVSGENLSRGFRVNASMPVCVCMCVCVCVWGGGV